MRLGINSPNNASNMAKYKEQKSNGRKMITYDVEIFLHLFRYIQTYRDLQFKNI